eukprot:SAG31_NODE_273_length_18667_cov_3.603619_22_plen_105_part_00
MGSFGDPGSLQLDTADVKAALSPAAKYLSDKSVELVGKAKAARQEVEERGFRISTSVMAFVLHFCHSHPHLGASSFIHSICQRRLLYPGCCVITQPEGQLGKEH